MGRRPAGRSGTDERPGRACRSVGRTSCRGAGRPGDGEDPLTVAKLSSAVLAQGRQTGRQAGFVEAVVAGTARADDDVVEHGRHDRVLLVEVEVVPVGSQLVALAEVRVERARAGGCARAAYEPG